LYIYTFSSSTPTTSFLLQEINALIFVLGTCCTNLSILSMNFPLLPKRAAKVALFSFPPNFFRCFFHFLAKNSKNWQAFPK